MACVKLEIRVHVVSFLAGWRLHSSNYLNLFFIGLWTSLVGTWPKPKSQCPISDRRTKLLRYIITMEFINLIHCRLWWTLSCRFPFNIFIDSCLITTTIIDYPDSFLLLCLSLIVAHLSFLSFRFDFGWKQPLMSLQWWWLQQHRNKE